MIVVSTKDIGNAQNITDDDISSDTQETSRLRYLLWPLVKLMTLLRFWRKSKDEESDEDLDKTEQDEPKLDQVSKGKLKFQYHHGL